MKQNIVNFNSKGELHGEYVTYHDNGKIDDKGQWFHGQIDGYWEWYWMDGSIWRKMNYNKDKLHGLYLSQTSNKEIITFGKYKNGNEIGLWIDVTF